MVEWVDSCRLFSPNVSWRDIADIPDPYDHLCVTVGFVIARNNKGIILCPSVGSVEFPTDRHAFGSMMIPRSAIRTIRYFDGEPPPDE